MSKTVLKHVVIGVVLGVGGVVLLAVSVAVVGALNMSATQKPGPLDALGHLAWETSLFWRAPDAKNPDQTDAAVAEGLEHYSSSCVYCHGARGVEAAEWATGMLPLPPDLTAQETQERSDGDLFYIVQNGVRMTGMPAFGPQHSTQEIWHIVSFIRALPKLDEEESDVLRDAVAAHEHGGHSHHRGDVTGASASQPAEPTGDRDAEPHEPRP